MASCTVYCKSCASMTEVPTGSVQLAVTSLPNVFANLLINTTKTDASWLLLYNRAYVLEQALPFLAPMANEVARILKDDGCFVLNAGCAPDSAGISGFASLLPLSYAEYIMMRSPLRLLYDIMIVQTRDAEGEVFVSGWEFERGIVTLQQHLLVFAKTEAIKMKATRPTPTVWTYQMPVQPKEGLPTPFSATIIHNLLTVFSDENDTVLDPCAGLGSLWPVARADNRNCIMYEINPRFVDLMKLRFPDAEFH